MIDLVVVLTVDLTVLYRVRCCNSTSEKDGEIRLLTGFSHRLEEIIVW